MFWICNNGHISEGGDYPPTHCEETTSLHCIDHPNDHPVMDFDANKGYDQTCTYIIHDEGIETEHVCGSDTWSQECESTTFTPCDENGYTLQHS